MGREKPRIDRGYSPLFASLSRNDSADQAVVFNPKTQQLFHKDFPSIDPVSASTYQGLISASYSQVETNYILMFNGTSFVPVAQGTSFQFGIDSFTVTGIGSDTQQIGSGVWKAAGELTFSASYNAGPPTEASISLQDGLSGDGFTMGTSPFENTTNPNDINYPTSVGKDQVGFRLSATKSIESASSDKNNLVDFYNFRAFAAIDDNLASGIDQAVVTAMSESNSDLTNSVNATKTVSVGSGKFLGVAFRDGLGSPAMILCGEGVNKITVPPSTANNSTSTPVIAKSFSVENGNGFSETYRIFVSSGSNLAAHSTKIETSNNSQVHNYLYWGTGSSDPATSDDIKALDFSASYSSSIIGKSLVVGGTYTTQRVYLAIPQRYGTKDTDYALEAPNGFEFSMNDNPTATIDVINPVGFRETYNIFKSAQRLNSPQTINIVSS